MVYINSNIVSALIPNPKKVIDGPGASNSSTDVEELPSPIENCLYDRSSDVDGANSGSDDELSSTPGIVPNHVKPTCRVPPYKEQGTLTMPGYTGLRNIGNTCFMNAVLQALVNTKDLRDYFLQKLHYIDINQTNPLGMKGHLAMVFGDFMADMWSGMKVVHEPSNLKKLIGQKATQFANYAQHDAQEFLTFLLDGLHEDLNRIVTKGTTETIESDGLPDEVIAEKSWRNHLARNDSIIVDLFHGQLKSHLRCPECFRESVTFDPFVSLPVPFPKTHRLISLYFWYKDPYMKPLKVLLK
ncbi:unnamed protein product [Soboliphyme baturini]|uniref:ubiquitinyl hydrolase 1 n=1 Tax=Soboliphyme baturini TaxID=241478 RepID=A0A183IU98_9BILA|nr:unnamed protein product [Soboliphyme baturini]